MPFYPLKKINALAQTRQAYLRGVRGYNTGWVRNFSAGANAFYPEYLTAEVLEEPQQYHVEIGFDEAGETEYLECGCAQFQPESGACKHIVSVLVHKYYQDMICQLPTAAQLMHRQTAQETDPAAQQLIDHYMTREAARLAITETPTATKAALTPILSLATGRPVLCFTVGVSRPYVLRNLHQFAENMRLCETVEYGKQLRLLHHPDSFAPGSRKMLDFLLGELGTRGVNAPTAAASPGELLLSPAGFDRLFSLLEGQHITLRQPTGDQRVALAQGDPILEVTVEAEGEGIRLYEEETLTASGLNTLYLLHHNVLYHTSPDYSRRMAEWVRVQQRATDGLYVAPAALPAFCSGVLATVRPFVQLDGDVQALEQYRPRKLEVQIYLDVPEPDVVTARVEYHYEDTVFLPFISPKAEQETEDAPWRDPLEEMRVRTIVQRHFTALQPQTGLLVLRGDEEQLFDFVTRGVDELRRVAAVFAADSFDRIALASAPRVSLGVSLSSGLLHMDIDMAELDGVDLAGIITGYREKRAYHRLKNGQFIQLDQSALFSLAELSEGLGITEQELRSGHITLPKYRALYLERVLQNRTNLYVHRNDPFRGLLERCRAAAENEYPVPASLRPVLRQYQKSGYRWLRTMEELQFGGILADDMGLGKTIQVIALLLSAKEEGRTALPSLVVCPTSLVFNWEREIQRFAPVLTTLCVTGDAAARHALLQQTAQYDVIITSYDMLKRDVEDYASLAFHYHILDEAQYIKNSTTQNAKSVKAIQAVQRFALTGTPVENRLSELWSIFDFLMPGLLFTYTKFRARFEVPIVRQEDARALERLGQMVSPFILRRLKRDVLTELPPKTERILPATMETPQRQVYLDTLRQLREQLESSRGARLSGEKRMTVLAMLTRLRQICCDPRLCCEGYVGSSCKLEACVELVTEAAAGGHKVLLFSQFTSMLALLQQRLHQENIRCYLLQGSTSKEQRAALVDAFNSDDTPVFLISLKAGGTGLNLTGADMVIHYDPWWNLSAQNQATDRAHRIGQKNPVQVVRLVAQDTIEEAILRLQEDKWQLAQAVITADGLNVTAMSPEELLALLE